MPSTNKQIIRESLAQAQRALASAHKRTNDRVERIQRAAAEKAKQAQAESQADIEALEQYIAASKALLKRFSSKQQKDVGSGS